MKRKIIFRTINKAKISDEVVRAMKSIAIHFVKALQDKISLPSKKRLVWVGETFKDKGKQYFFLEAYIYPHQLPIIPRDIKKIDIEVVIVDGKLKRTISIDFDMFIEDDSFENLLKDAEKQFQD